MTALRSEIRPGAYYDSIVLMKLQRALVDLPGVLDAGVVMGTEANKALLKESDLGTQETGAAAAEDLVIVVRAKDEETAREAITQIDMLLARRSTAIASKFQPRSLQSAAKLKPDAGWVSISVPGRYASQLAREALDLDRHVFLYSDNVSLEDEVSLKETASQRGLLLMGPDCGTAIINGTGFGFANRVRRGSIGLVGASGTGLQVVSVGIHNLGGGISQAIGTGSRDLQRSVGARSTLAALELLSRDPQTRVMVLVSKPPDAAIVPRVLAAARNTGKPVVINFIGYPAPVREPAVQAPGGTPIPDLVYAPNLGEAAGLAFDLLRRIGDTPIEAGNRQGDPPQQGFLRGLFSGGTLAYEAVLSLQEILEPLHTNVPLRESQRLLDPTRSQGHTIVDLGADEFTVGRPHPMIDNDLRIRRMRQEASDSQVGILLLDVVLGEGAHPDPAGELAGPIAECKKSRPLDIVVVLVGTDSDPQGLDEQRDRLAAAGAEVFHSTQEAVAYIRTRLAVPVELPDKPLSIDRFQQPVGVINVGLEMFAESLISQGANVVHVDWRPPASGDERLMTILRKMKG